MSSDEYQKLLAVAANSKKPTRGKVFEIVQGLAASMADTEHADDLALLYRYFLPTIPKRPKNVVDWLAKAVDQKELRIYLRYIHVVKHDKKLLAVASDGHRIHFSYDHVFSEEGVYNTAGERAVCDSKRSLLDVVSRFLSHNSGKPRHVEVNKVERIVALEGQVLARMPEGPLVNAAYFDAAVGGAAEVDAVYIGHERALILAGLPFGTAVIETLKEV